MRDPAMPRRVGGALAALCVLWPLAQAAGMGQMADQTWQSLQVLGQFLASFVPPETSAEFLPLLWTATWQTLAIATSGMLLAGLIAVPLAYAATTALPGSRSLRWLARGVLAVLRGIPELVWALVLVRVFGLGPTAGVLALGLTYGGMLGKVYAEILESQDRAPAQALLRAGARPVLALLYGALPQAAKELTSYTVYRWECAIRASVVMGFVGAGGLGQLMDQAMKMLNGGEASAILITLMALVLCADALSRALREGMNTSPAPRAWAGGWRSTLLAVALVAAVVWSWHGLALAPGALWTAEAMRSIGQFMAGFWPLDLSSAWLRTVAQGVWETLAISIMGTLLAAVGGLALALPRWRRSCAAVLNVLRSVPELVWATIAALVVGLGPLAGVLALALHTAGVLGRLYAEALDNAPRLPVQALRASGSPRVLAFLYGTLPVVAPQLLAYTLYRWEMNIRMAAILGFVGAGGLGQLLYVNLSLFQYAQGGVVIVAMLALSIAADQCSAWLRQRLG